MKNNSNNYSQFFIKVLKDISDYLIEKKIKVRKGGDALRKTNDP